MTDQVICRRTVLSLGSTLLFTLPPHRAVQTLRRRTGWLLLGGLLWLWSPPAQADDTHCYELRNTLTSLASASLFSPDPAVFTDPSVNAAVLSHFINRIDHWKLLFTTTDLDRLQTVAESNLAEVMRNPAVAPSCTFVHKSQQIFNQSLARVRAMIADIIASSMDFNEADAIILHTELRHHPQTEAEQFRRWQQVIKLEKLLRVKPTTQQPSAQLNAPELNQQLLADYEVLLSKFTLPETIYIYWALGLAKALDPYGRLVVNPILPRAQPYLFMISPLLGLLNLPKTFNHLNRHTLGALPHGYNIKFLKSHPPSFRIRLLKKGSFLGHVSSTAPAVAALPAPAAPAHHPSPPHISRRTKKEADHSQYEAIILEPTETQFVYRHIQPPPLTHIFHRTSSYAYTVKVKASPPGSGHLNVLILSVRHLLKAGSNNSLKYSLKQLRSDIQSYLPGWRQSSDAVILDLRNANSLTSFYTAIAPQFFSMLFGAKILPLFQLKTPPATDLITSLTPHDVRRLVTSSMVPGFSSTTPVVILLNAHTKGYLETSAHAMRLMNRALIVGAGTQQQTYGLYFHKQSTQTPGSIHSNKMFVATQHSLSPVYHIDGSVQSMHGLDYDIYLKSNSPAGHTLTSPYSAFLPWQYDKAHTYQPIAALDYPNFNMVPESVRAALARIQQKFKQKSYPPRQTTDPTIQNSLSLRWQDYKKQIEQSRKMNQQLNTLGKNLAHDHAMSQVDKPLKHQQALQFLKQDPLLMRTIVLTSHYYYLLKKGHSDQNFFPIAIEAATP